MTIDWDLTLASAYNALPDVESQLTILRNLDIANLTT